MKKNILSLLVVVLTISLSSVSFAQSNMSLKKNNSASNKEVCKVKVRAISSGCEISFINSVVSPRDAASGMASGKRQHKPLKITKEIDKSSPLLAKTSTSGGMGAGKVSMKDLSCTITSKGRTMKVPVRNNQFTIPSDGVDDDCDMVLSWTWTVSNSSVTERCVCPLKLTMKDGACISANTSSRLVR